MTLLLDPDIRDWVVLPLFVIMVAAGLLRHYVGQLLQGERQRVPAIPQRAQSVLQHARRIRTGPAAHYVVTWKWHAKRQHYIGLLREEADWCEAENEKRRGEGGGADDSSDPLADMMNPMGMMKGNMAFMVQNMIMMQGIQHFFSGFILLKVPFPLTAGFKSMFQRGLADLPDLEPSYVSSLSWYFLVMYGLRSFFRLAIGGPSIERKEQEVLLTKQGYQNPPNPAAGPKQDAESAAKMLRQEAETLELFVQQHRSEMDGVERRLLGKKRYPKKKMGSGSEEADFLLGVGGKSPFKSKKRQ